MDEIVGVIIGLNAARKRISTKEAEINVLSGLQGELICGSFTVPMRELIACAYALG